tara:strand:- start:3996 stop:4994 length:999 start_codon:yes stop_codon:yes gene_type:complete
MELSIATLPDFVRNAEILFLKGLDSVNMAARNSGIFRVDNISNHTGNTKEYSEIDLEEYAEIKGEGDQSSRARVQQGYSKVGTLYRVSKDIGITYEMRNYNKYIDVVTRLQNLGKIVSNRIELDLSHRITFATATSYTSKEGVTIDTTVGDTLALASTVHTVRGAATTYRNRLANNPVFSKGGVEGMEQMIIENTINQFGEKVTVPYDILWSTEDANTVNTIKEFLRSTAAPEATNAGVVNVYAGKYRHVVLPRVATTAAGANDTSKAKYWGLASSSNSQAFLGMNEEPHMKPQNGNIEFSTEDFNLGASAGYFIVIPGARFFAISTGDATA